MGKQLKKRPLKSELSYLARYEFYSIIQLAFMYFAVKLIVDDPPYIFRMSSLYPLALLCFILLEGSLYWFNSLRRVEKKTAFSRIKIGRFYYYLLWINWLLIVAYPFILWLFRATIVPVSLLIGVLFYIMVIIEQINYFHIRLSYETAKGSLLIIKPFMNLLTGKGKRSQVRQDIQLYLKDKTS